MELLSQAQLMRLYFDYKEYWRKNFNGCMSLDIGICEFYRVNKGKYDEYKPN